MENISDKILRDKPFEILSDRKYNLYKDFDNISTGIVKCQINKL